MAVIIRDATVDDVPGLIPVALEFHRGSHYRDLPFDVSRVSGFLLGLIRHDDGRVWVAEHDNVVVAGIGGMIISPYFSSAAICQEMFWFVSHGSRGGIVAQRLFARLRSWGRGRGASVLAMSAFSGTRAESVFKNIGLSNVETVWWGAI